MRKNLSPALLLPLLFLLAACGTVPSGQVLQIQFDSGVAAYDAGDYPKAYAIWHAIEDQDLAAMRNVAMMLRKGQGVPQDPKKALAVYERAASIGLPTAQADLADMLLKGEAGPPNPERALPLLQAAAAANHPIAQFELARMYENGSLVPKDLNTARQLYAAAASHGMKEAQTRLDELGPPSMAEASTQADGPVRLMQPAPQGPVAPAPAAAPDLRAGHSQP